MTEEEQINKAYKQTLNMPHSKARNEILYSLVKRADIIKNHHLQKYLRWMYASELMRCGDQGKVFAVVAEYIALRGEEEEWCPPGGIDGIEYMADYCLEVLCYLPQITLKQAEGIIKILEKMLTYNRFGRRLYYQRLFRFYSVIDANKALEYFYLFKNTRRDICSDCKACEQADMVRFFHRIGDITRADELARPVFDGTLKCHDVPRNVWQVYLQRALDYKDLKKAVPLAEALYRESDINDPTDLGYFGAVMRCFAFTSQQKAVKILKRLLEGWEVLWDKERWFSFLTGAWTVCHEYAKHDTAIYIPELTGKVPFWQENGIYNTREMEKWFYNQAVSVAESFDRRNGTDYYIKELERVVYGAGYKEGQHFWLIEKN
ncbi:MAG: hypothetical protein OSJ45_00795 [Lachnospiraceae bacterium]|nr:hypothetical protein [Lachnospiraceae bacterium]